MRQMILDNIPPLDYACSEAFNTLATNVTFSGSNYKVIMLTSCVFNEGKSYTSLNLVRTLGGMGYSTLLIDADLRKSVMLSKYGARITGQRLGLTHYLAGRVTLEDAIYQTNLNNVCIMPTGKTVTNSLPLLNSPNLLDLMQTVRNSFDYVIVDSPPIGMLIDAAMIASACDATILVVTSEHISRRQLNEAKQQIERSGCTILGSVLNKVVVDTHKYRKYYYKSYYSRYNDTPYNMHSEDAPGEKKPKERKKRRSSAEDATGGGAGEAGA